MRPFWTVPASLPRHAFSARDAARAGDVWRAFQEVAVEASTLAGWPPLRYRDEDVAFVMRTMTVVHAREVLYGEKLDATTWVRSFRRGMFSHREIRLCSARGEIASAAQTWVHVRAAKDPDGHWQLTPVRAPESLERAFPIHDATQDDATRELAEVPELPSFAPLAAPQRATPFELEVEAWITTMDPLDHVNHPAYVDWCDEATSRALRRAGLDPVMLVPVAESATYSRGVQALERALVSSRVVGVTEAGDVVLDHQITVDDARCASVTTVRRVIGVESSRLVEALGGF
ncbi:MAG: thioesterase [Myxococcota bacterium]|jgi:acyl-CoA thioesterase FadM|nr:thioesterase [Myxococcota bacterium]